MPTRSLQQVLPYNQAVGGLQAVGTEQPVGPLPSAEPGQPACYPSIAAAVNANPQLSIFKTVLGLSGVRRQRLQLHHMRRRGVLLLLWGCRSLCFHSLSEAACAEVQQAPVCHWLANDGLSLICSRDSLILCPIPTCSGTSATQASPSPCLQPTVRARPRVTLPFLFHFYCPVTASFANCLLLPTAPERH